MIPGFELETKELNAEEFKMMQLIVPKLRNHIGEDKAVNGKVIFNYLKDKGYKLDMIRLRKIINFIRTSDVIPFLCATNNGYFIEYNKEKIQKYIESLKQRERAISFLRHKIEEQVTKYSHFLSED